MRVGRQPIIGLLGSGIAIVGIFGFWTRHGRADQGAANTPPDPSPFPVAAAEGRKVTAKRAPPREKNVLFRQKLPGGHMRVVSVSDTHVLQPGDTGWVPDPTNPDER